MTSYFLWLHQLCVVFVSKVCSLFSYQADGFDEILKTNMRHMPSHRICLLQFFDESHGDV
jgi:hypothetical protein